MGQAGGSVPVVCSDVLGSVILSDMRAFALLTFCFLVAGLGIHADSLYLNNGDRITGTLEGVKDGTIRFVTDYAGTLAVQQTEVRGIATAGPYGLEFEDGTVVEGVLVWRDDSQYVLVGETLKPVVVSNIIAIGVDAAALAEPAESEAAKEKTWSGAVDAALSVRSGDTDTIDSNVAFTGVRKGARNVLTLRSSGAYGEVNDAINARRVDGEAKLQYYPRDRLYVFGLIGAGHDAMRKLELRANAAGGVGYDFIKNDVRGLSADIGLDYTWERWTQYDPAGRDAAKKVLREARQNELRAFLIPFAETPQIPTVADIVEGIQLLRGAMDIDLEEEIREEDGVNLRLSGHYHQSVFKKGLLKEELTLFPSLDELGEFRATSELSYSTPLTQRLDLRVSLKSEYDADPGQGAVSRFDNTLLTGLRYAF